MTLDIPLSEFELNWNRKIFFYRFLAEIAAQGVRNFSLFDHVEIFRFLTPFLKKISFRNTVYSDSGQSLKTV